MFWSWDFQGTKYASWGSPRRLPQGASIENLEPRYDVHIYEGEKIYPHEKTVFMMQGDSTLGLGDSIWLLSFLRDIYRIKARRRGYFTCMSSESILKFYSNFLPKSFNLQLEYMLWDEFQTYDHKLPGMYYWKEMEDESDRSWLDNKSLLERLYSWTGMQYFGLPDWGEFTNEDVLYPSDNFWSDLGLDKNEQYIFYQWHSSGRTKNLPPSSNLKVLKHLTKTYGLKVYVVGRLKSLDGIEKISGVVNLSGKTEGRPESLFTLAFNSEFIVCPDSAGVHMSEAFKIPCVTIMSSLPYVYIASKYKIPAAMYGSGHCPFKPCGIVHELPLKTKCPKGTKNYCKVMEDIDLEMLDRCIKKSFDNRDTYKQCAGINFYDVQKLPISF